LVGKIPGHFFRSLLGALSLGKAAELAETNRMAFGELVGQGGIARHYGDAELAQDLSYARSE
jgi:predicted HTH domain antitoxin